MKHPQRNEILGVCFGTFWNSALEIKKELKWAFLIHLEIYSFICYFNY